jgi:hypothetical protein
MKYPKDRKVAIGLIFNPKDGLTHGLIMVHHNFVHAGWMLTLYCPSTLQWSYSATLLIVAGQIFSRKVALTIVSIYTTVRVIQK